MTESSQPRVAGLLLAAGGSSRLGRPKQLVQWEGKTLIRRAVEALIDAGCDPVVVVLGAEIEQSREELGGLNVDVFENPDWERGMSSSIRVGIGHFLAAPPSPEAVLITLCDQPFVTSDKLRTLIDRFAAGHMPIIAAEYHNVRGVPALFSAALFRELATLDGDRGARDLIRSHPEASSIQMPEAAFDIDEAPIHET